MKTATKTFVALALILSFLMTGAFAVTTTYTANLNEGVLLAHDGPSLDRITH